MKKKYLLIGVVVVVVLGIGVAVLFSTTEPQAAVTQESEKKESAGSDKEISSTNQTSSPSTDEGEASNTNESKGSTTTTPERAQYQKFTLEDFQEAAGKKRLIFFYDPTQQASTQLNDMLRDNFDKLPADVAIFSAHIVIEYELAAQLGVTEAGTVVRYDDNGRAMAVYQVLDQKPTLEVFRQALDI